MAALTPRLLERRPTPAIASRWRHARLPGSRPRPHFEQRCRPEDVHEVVRVAARPVLHGGGRTRHLPARPGPRRHRSRSALARRRPLPAAVAPQPCISPNGDQASRRRRPPRVHLRPRLHDPHRPGVTALLALGVLRHSSTRTRDTRRPRRNPGHWSTPTKVPHPGVSRQNGGSAHPRRSPCIGGTARSPGWPPG